MVLNFLSRRQIQQVVFESRSKTWSANAEPSQKYNPSTYQNVITTTNNSSVYRGDTYMVQIPVQVGETFYYLARNTALLKLNY